MAKTLSLLVGIALFAACGGDPDPAPEPAPEFENNGQEPDEVAPGPITFLTPTEHLTRASIALRGTRPTEAELERVRADPDAVGALVDGYLKTEEFAETIRDLHDEAWQLRTFFFLFPPRGELEQYSMVTLNRWVQEQPLRLAEHIVMNDRPYTELVTADYTMANGPVATVWGLDYDGNGTEWKETRWPQEGRVHAGILSESIVWTRHYSTPLNAQRSRANQVSKALLCFNFLDNDVRVDGNVDLSSPEAVLNAVKSPACASCHQTLDPLAGHFWEYEYFYFPSQAIVSYPVEPNLSYRPEYARIHKPYFTDGRTGYFGQPSETLADLGAHIAEDPRFSLCAARRFYAHFAQVGLGEVPVETAGALQKAFVDSGLKARVLARAVVMSDAFRTLSVEEGSSAPEHAVRRLTPRQLSRAINDLTGFTWSTKLTFALFAEAGVTSPYGTVDLMQDHLFGYEVVAGGRDDFIVTRSEHTTNPTSALVYRGMAREAAGYVVAEDCERDAEDRRLLGDLDCDSDDEATVRGRLAHLHLRVLSEFAEPDGELVDESYALWTAVRAGSDSRRAWAAVLTAFFQDTRFIHY